MSTDAPQRPSVFLIDDHPLVRQGIAAVLQQAGFTVSGEAGGVQASLVHPGLATTQVAILDLSLEQSSGLELIPELARRGIRVVIYSMHEDATIVRRALLAGATGYVTKREAAQSLAEAVHMTLAGKRYVSPRAASNLAQQVGEPDLSPQQRQLYELLGQGLGTQEIADELRLSPRTVETYCTRLIDKLGLTGMKELRRHAIADRYRRSV